MWTQTFTLIYLGHNLCYIDGMTSSNDKSRTIKIDIRSLGYEKASVDLNPSKAVRANYFDDLDYRFLFEQAYDAILLADATGNVLAANTSATRFFGYENSCLTGNNIRSLIAGVTDRLLGEIQGVITEGRYMRIQAFAVHRDGKSFTVVEVIVMGNRVRAPNQVCYLVRDVQSRWQAEQTLLSVFHAMDNTDAGIGIVTLDGTVTYANRTMTSLLAGGEESAVIGQKLNVWFDRKSVVDPMLANIGRRQSWSGEQRMIRDAKTTWLMVSAVPDINEDQELSGMVLSLRDTAERRRAEIAEYQVERNRIMMESLAGVCHALGQPATVLLTSIEILKLQGHQDEQAFKELVEMSYDAVIQLRDLLQKMNAKRMYAAEPYLPSRGDQCEMVNVEVSEQTKGAGLL